MFHAASSTGSSRNVALKVSRCTEKTGRNVYCPGRIWNLGTKPQLKDVEINLPESHLLKRETGLVTVQDIISIHHGTFPCFIVTSAIVSFRSHGDNGNKEQNTINIHF
jgi:hypothetical protein